MEKPSQSLSHIDAAGRAVMVDISAKPVTDRRARARATVRLSADADAKLRAGALPKGSPLEVVRLTALNAVKNTSQWLPLCHPLCLTGVNVEIDSTQPCQWQIHVQVRAQDRTGVEMEAMSGAAAGALALYDMVKAVDRSATILEMVLLEKSGGKSGHFVREESVES